MKGAHKNKGFTLVEVLVSLLIFSTAILGLMSAGTQNIRILHAIEQKQIAGMIADNQLLLAQYASLPIQTGTRQGDAQMAGQIWQWQVLTEETTQNGFFKMTAQITQGANESIIVSRVAFTNRKTPLTSQ